MFITTDNDHKFYELIERAVQRGLLYHIFFWVIFFLFMVINRPESVSLGANMVRQSIRVIFYIIIVYINLYYLFPRYLKLNKLFTYLTLLISLVAIATPIEVLLHHFLFSANNVSLAEEFTFSRNSAVFLGTFFVGFSSSIYKIINDWMEHQRERMDLQRQNLTSELKYLKTQINPHFFFNTLNSLYALTLKKSDRAPEIVLKLSEMMRYMLYESNERMLSLDQEINYIENYLDLEKLRHGENFKIEMKIKGDPSGHKIAPLLFIPFLENSFKHGIDHELKSGYVSISLDIQPKELHLNVINSLPQKEIVIAKEEKKVGGIGLTNVRRRLNILYPKRHKLEVNKTDKEFQVNLDLQINKSTNTTK